VKTTETVTVVVTGNEEEQEKVVRRKRKTLQGPLVVNWDVGGPSEAKVKMVGKEIDEKIEKYEKYNKK
jgi:hypothetical protein